MWFFKSKERKALEEMDNRWKGLLATAVGQLKTGKPSFDGKYLHAEQFLQYVSKAWPMDAYMEMLEELVGAKLCDGSPVLSKFFIHERKRDCFLGQVTLALHDTSVVEFLDSKGIALNNHSSQTAAEYFSDAVSCMYINVPDNVREAIRTCQKFYKEMVRLRGELEGDQPAVYATSGMSVKKDLQDTYRFVLTVTPELVDKVVGELSKYGLMYLDEYREYLIGQLAEASIDRDNGWTLNKVQYDVPRAECDIYGNFLKDLVRKNEREAKNKENKAVIKAIEAAAQKRIDEHNRIAEEKYRKLAERKKG